MPLFSNFQQLYMNFVKNTKFMSPKTKPVIAFMQNSLVEIFSLDDHLTYQHGFVYIRQLAIHLRNAILQKKKVLSAHAPSFPLTDDSVENVLWHSLASCDLGREIGTVTRNLRVRDFSHDGVSLQEILFKLWLHTHGTQFSPR